MATCESWQGYKGAFSKSPKNSGWTKQFLGPPPPPSPALYTVHAWAPQKASVVHSSCGVASVWSAHLQPPPATSSHLQPPPGIDTADIAKYSQPTVALRWFLHLLWTLQMCDVSGWPGAWAGWAGHTDHKIWTLGQKQLSWLMLATCSGGRNDEYRCSLRMM